MATKYTLTTAFTSITETSGTIQNVGNESVELASSTNAVAGEGIVLNPSEKRSFKGTLSARSIGDAGAKVNVVDFTEAGEGGEEYILPVASDTTLGGVKISNSFTVANDGTLSIKKSGKTILGAVKSSDDEGKVSVNNDGTMTYNPLGYRQPSTAYAVGDMKYHSALPTGWYLECTTAGTTGSGDLTITSPRIGGTVSDGTVIWTVRSEISNNFKVWNTTAYGDVASDLNDALNLGVYRYNVNTLNIPFSTSYGACLTLFTNEEKNVIAQIAQNIDMTNRACLYARGYESNVWTPWQQQEAIVAKSFDANGYIKYASGLIIQWGIMSTDTETITVTFPISFENISAPTVVCTSVSQDFKQITITNRGKSNFACKANAPYIFCWLAIGY